MLSRNFIGTIRDVVIDHDNRFGNPPLNAFEGTPDSSRVGPRNHADRNRERGGHSLTLSEGGGQTTSGESTRREGVFALSFGIAGQVPERSIGLAWKACVG